MSETSVSISVNANMVTIVDFNAHGKVAQMYLSADQLRGLALMFQAAATVLEANGDLNADIRPGSTWTVELD